MQPARHCMSARCNATAYRHDVLLHPAARYSCPALCPAAAHRLDCLLRHADRGGCSHSKAVEPACKTQQAHVNLVTCLPDAAQCFAGTTWHISCGSQHASMIKCMVLLQALLRQQACCCCSCKPCAPPGTGPTSSLPARSSQKWQQLRVSRSYE
jgi:hypothetical protein